VLGARPVVLAREMTKLHQEFLRGTAAGLREALRARPPLKGEITLLVGRAATPASTETPLAEAVEAAMEAGLGRMEAVKAVARQRGLSKREVYRAFEQLRG